MLEVFWNSETSCVSCGLKLFLKGKSYMEMSTLSLILNLGFRYSRSGLLYRMERKSEVLTSLVSFLSSFFSVNQCCTELSQFVDVFVSIIFNITVK